MYRTILVPLDGSSLAERALPTARRIARAVGARLVLLEVLPKPANPGDAAVTREAGLFHAAEGYLDEIVAREADSSNVETRIAVGDPAAVILEEAAYWAADLIVMSTHGRSGIGRWVYGSVADAVMRHASVPVLLVPAGSPAIMDADRPVRIVVTLDGSRVAESVLDPVADLADVVGGELVLLRVVEVHPTAYGAGTGYMMIDPTPEIEEAEAYLEAIATKLRSTGRSVETRQEFGFSVSWIGEVARQERADLIAMATHGSGGITRLVLGSVATGVVQRAGVPIFLVRPAFEEQSGAQGPAAATVPVTASTDASPAGRRER